MSDPYFFEQTFDSKEFPLLGEYDHCTFKGIDFSERDLSSYSFTDCIFFDGNFSSSKIRNTAFREVEFKGCKLIGLHFQDCNPFGLSFKFENCNLNHASFFQLKLKKTAFINCQLQEIDFAEADLTESLFQDCSLLLSQFHQTNLERCDFLTATGYSIDPEENRLNGAKFSIQGLPGLLDKYQIKIEE